MKFRKFLTIGIAALTVAAFSFGLAACTDPSKDPDEPDTPVGPDDPDTPVAEVTVEGGYGVFEAAYQVDFCMNLYEDGTYYYNQYTSAIYYGTYTAEEASGTDDQGRTIHYTITFDDTVDFGEGPHNIVTDAEGIVYLTGIYDSMSLATKDLPKQDEPYDEVEQTKATYYSTNYMEDVVSIQLTTTMKFYLNNVYGLGMAGASGTYTEEVKEDGSVVYTLTDGEDSSKVFTLTMNGANGTLEGGDLEAPYTMTSINPTLVVEFEMTGVNSWGASLTLTCYDDGTANMQIAIPGTPEFSDGLGTWTYIADGDYYVITFGTTIYTAENDGEGTYSFEYAIVNANFGGQKVVVSYKNEAEMVAYTFTYKNDWSYDLGTEIAMTARAEVGAESYTFTGAIWGGVGTLTITLAEDGSVTVVADAESVGAVGVEVTTGTWEANEDGSLAITINGNPYTATVSE